LPKLPYLLSRTSGKIARIMKTQSSSKTNNIHVTNALIPHMLGFAVLALVTFYAPESRARTPQGLDSIEMLTPVKETARFMLSGNREPAAELLQESIARRYRRSIGWNPEKIAGPGVRSILGNPNAFATTRGHFAELFYAADDAHVGFVSKRNAPQNDLYLMRKGQPPLGIQIKSLGKTATPNDYAREMIKDYRARYFVVPNEQVDGLRAHWLAKAEALQREEQWRLAAEAKRQAYRVEPLGKSTAELESMMQRGAKVLIRERLAKHAAFGAVLALTLAPGASELFQGGKLQSASAYEIARTGGLFGAAWGSEKILAKIRDGGWRGTWRGNAFTGCALIAAETGFSLWESGFAGAFADQRFYERLGGSVAGVSLSLAVGTYVGAQATIWATPTGWFAPLIGGAAAIVSGAAAGIAGQIGGEETVGFVCSLIGLKDQRDLTLWQMPDSFLGDVLGLD